MNHIRHFHRTLYFVVVDNNEFEQWKSEEASSRAEIFDVTKYTPSLLNNSNSQAHQSSKLYIIYKRKCTNMKLMQQIQKTVCKLRYSTRVSRLYALLDSASMSPLPNLELPTTGNWLLAYGNALKHLVSGEGVHSFSPTINDHLLAPQSWINK